MFARVLLLAVLINPEMGRSLALPIAFPTLLGIGYAYLLWRGKGCQAEGGLEVKNPMELGRAIQFALLFAIVLFVSKAAHHYFGSAGIYAAGALAGLTDVDTITISSARLAISKDLDIHTANISILLACTVNTLMKGFIAASIGGRALRRIVIPVFGTLSLGALGAGLIFLFF